MEEIRIVDTTLRDGDISLWAYGMTTGMMLPALRHMDEAGFDSMEFFLSLRFKKFVREHKEDPWDWLRLGTKEIKKTRLRYHGGLHSGFEFIPECIRRLVISTVAKYGIDLTRTSNAWNNFDAARQRSHRTEKTRHGNGDEPDLLDLAAPYRRILRAESARRGGAEAVSAVFQRRRRHVDARAHAQIGEADQTKHRRYPARVSRPLQQWLGAVQFARSGERRRAHRSYGDSAARQRLVATFDV